ncbi:hypothetical protein A6J66_022305 [Yersinia enterocolitica]|nr:hypothetical protein A6J66_022305 [Yersinia enterocolitica]
MFCIPVRPSQFFDLNQSFGHVSNNSIGKFMFYINFIKTTDSKYFCKFSTFLCIKRSKNHHYVTESGLTVSLTGLNR